MISRGTLLLAAAVGSAIYCLDPTRGQQRRTMVREKAVWARNRATRETSTLGREVRSCATDAIAEMRQSRGDRVPAAIDNAPGMAAEKHERSVQYFKRA